MDERWEAVERALPGRGRGTLRMLEQSLVSVREEERGTCFKLASVPFRYCMENLLCTILH